MQTSRLYAMLVTAATALGCQVSVQPTRLTRYEATTVQVSREFEIVLHADTNIAEEDRVTYDNAAELWRVTSQNRIRIKIAYDLTPQNLLEAIKANKSILREVRTGDKIVEWIDKEHPNITVLAATTEALSGARYVWFIKNRFSSQEHYSIAVHEFGHVAGLPDLPTTGSVMSRIRDQKAPSINEFTQEDIALCKAYWFCW